MTRCAAMTRWSRVPDLVCLAVILLLFGAKAAFAEPYKAEAGPHEIASFTADWQDADRNRAVPIKAYYPKDAEGPRPIVLVSHGLGGTREGLSYLGEHWASHGYICIHMQHLGSDDSVWKGLKAREILQAMRKAAMNPENALNRTGDYTFVINELQKIKPGDKSPLAGRLDLERIGIAGHSFGAWTAMAAGGMTVGGKRGKQYGDPRIRCMIPLSPAVTSHKRLYETAYGSLNIPALFMTGTLDTSPINNTTAEQRLVPYRTMPGASKDGQPKYQINFNGADHMTFSGETNIKRLRKVDLKKEPVFHGLILQSTTAFLDCYLLGDADAKKWLNGGAFVEAVGEYGEVELDAE